MKRLMMLLLAGVLAVTMTACGGSSEPAEEPIEEPQIEEQAPELDPDFKAAMDSYEAFMNDYADFMEKYAESDDMTAMLGDYMDYMSKYQEAMDALEKIESQDMTDAELAYYLEVTNRVSQRLLEASSNM